MRKFKNLMTAFMITFSFVLLSACGGTEENSTTEGDNGGESVEAKIGIVFTEGGLGGESFNDLTFAGVKEAAEDFNIEYDYVEPSSVSDQEIAQDEMAASGEYDLIIAVGFEQVDALETVATNYPEQQFALIDATIDLPNVTSYVSKEEEASFLLGAMSVLLKKSDTVDMLGEDKTLGFIGGVESPLIKKFAAGYSAGAKYIDEEYNILIDYVGGFNDPSSAKTISETMYSQGADLQYHAAGASGMGMFQAAQENDFVTIGVNSNQNAVAPDNIVASMMKLVNQAAYDVIEDIVNGDFNSGITVLGLEDGGVDYSVEGSNIEVIENIIEVVEDLRGKIINGDLEIPNTLEDIDEFLVNNRYESKN